MKKKLLILGIAAVLLIISFKFFPWPCDCEPKTEIMVGDTAINVEIADTSEERMRGLSGRESLKEGEGMLFVFDEPGLLGIWMKDMNFAIDIIWIDSEKRVIGVERDISPSTYPETFRPSRAVKYVLEVPAGFSQRHEIDTGDEVLLAF